MTNHEIGIKLANLIREERKITNQVLEVICMAMEQRSFLELGYASMFDWLVKGFGYSNSAAFRRIEAARLLKAVPTATEKLEEGKLSLTTLAKAQTILRQQEKISGKKVTTETKKRLIDSIERKSTLEAEKTLITLFPEASKEVHREHRRVINEYEIRHQMNLSNEAAQNLVRAKEVLSHKFPNATDAEIVSYALKFLLEEVDPLRQAEKRSKSKSTAPAKASTRASRLKIIQQAKGQCTFRDPITGTTCGSSYQVQFDHIVPKALGGSNDVTNLRVLCRQHNLLMAETVFGKKLIDKYRS